MTSEFDRLQQLMDAWNNNIIAFINHTTSVDKHPLLSNPIRRAQYERTLRQASTMRVCLHLNSCFIHEQSVTLGTLATLIAGTKDYMPQKAAQNRLKPILERLEVYQLVTIIRPTASDTQRHYRIMGAEKLHCFFQQCFYADAVY